MMDVTGPGEAFGFVKAIVRIPVLIVKWIMRSWRKWWFWGVIIPLFLCFYWLLELMVVGTLNWAGLSIEIVYCTFALGLAIYLKVTKIKREKAAKLMFETLREDYLKLSFEELEELEACYQKTKAGHEIELTAIRSVLNEKYEKRAKDIHETVKDK